MAQIARTDKLVGDYLECASLYPRNVKTFTVPCPFEEEEDLEKFLTLLATRVCQMHGNIHSILYSN